MPLVTIPQANPLDEVTADLINRGPNALAAVVNGQLDDTNIASFSGTKISANTISSSSMQDSGNLEKYRQESGASFVQSGLIWSTLTGLNGAMTAGIVYASSGIRVSVSAIASHTFTASKDTHVSIDNNGAIAYSEVANNSNPPALPVNSQWIARVITNGSAIAAIANSANNNPNRPHFCSLFFSTGGPTGGQVVPANTQANAVFDAIDPNTYGLIPTTGGSANITIARDGNYNVQLQVSAIDGSSPDFIVWLYYSFDNGVTYGYASRQAGRLLASNSSPGATYSWTSFFPAGTKLQISWYSSTNAIRLAGAASPFYDRYYNGPKFTVAEIR
jgi:hypothetical protein